MSTKIFIGNLAYGVTNDMVRPLFEHYGSVTECDVLGSYGFVVSKQLFYHCCRLICLTLLGCVTVLYT